MVSFSIIMPVYNVEQFVGRAIQSILNQELVEWELILVNDGSKDNSGIICEQFAKSDRRIKVIHQQNSGSGIARQNGIDHATGTHICFIDPDDYLEKSALLNNKVLIERYTPQVLVNGYNRILKKNNNEQNIKEVNPEITGCFNKEQFISAYEKFARNIHKVVWNKVYEKSFLSKYQIKFSNLPVGQDWSFNLDVYSVVEKILITDDKYYYYDTTIDSSSVKKYRDNRLEIELNLIDKQKKMIQMWQKDEEFSRLISLDFYNAIYVEINNIKNSYNLESIESKVWTLENSLDKFNLNEKITQLKITDFKSYKEKLLFALIKNKNYGIVFRILMI
ncbi:glycosyltransferase family 2 protein [Aerococcus urinaeequi]|uniref:glycosyltransferase family 2 protein n=1 Tax=Aerococcus urinaeequi TaxID=51665 RepID=UPI003D6C537C